MGWTTQGFDYTAHRLELRAVNITVARSFPFHSSSKCFLVSAERAMIHRSAIASQQSSQFLLHDTLIVML
jgi:hypothetical protein